MVELDFMVMVLKSVFMIMFVRRVAFVIILSSFYGCSSLLDGFFGRASSQSTQNNNLEKIILIQVAGFADEHLPIAKFARSEVEARLALEKMDCIGKTWAFNNYKIRPTASESFLSQYIGSGDVKLDCQDFNKFPFWANYGRSGVLAGIFEFGHDPSETLKKIYSCSEEGNKFKDLTISWKMATGGEGSSFFSGSENVPLLAGIHYDKSCRKEGCISDFSENIKFIFDKFFSKPFSNIFIIRDFEYQSYLEKNDFLKAREHLLALDKIVDLLIKYQTQNPNVLILFAGSGAKPINFPLQGEAWKEYERKGKGLSLINQSLMGTVMAKGPQSNRFCGLYGDLDMAQRVIEKHNAGSIFNLF